MSNIVMSDIETKVQNKLRNVVNSPVTQPMRVSTYNDVISFLQSKANWNSTKRIATFEYLNKETDYSLSNTLSISDFKQFKDLRFVKDSITSHSKEFEEIDGNDLAILEAEGTLNNVLTFEDRDGDKIMRILSDKGQGDTIIDDMEDLTTGRTWASNTTGSDATTLVQDTTRSKTGSASLRFNIDADQSSNNYSEIYTSTVFSTVIDASDIENKGHFRFWLGLHSMSAANLARISSVTFVWGDDASATPSTKANYWSKTVTTTINNGTFKATWNRISFDWATATKTGSPSAAGLRYFEIRVTYTSAMTDTNNIRIDQVKMFDPQEMELVYWSSYFVSVSGTWQELFTTGTINTAETMLMDKRHTNLVVNLALMDLYPQKERSSDDYLRVKELAMKDLELAILTDGNPITREAHRFEVNGYSNGREDSTQW